MGGNPDFQIPDPEKLENRKKSCDCSFQSSWTGGSHGHDENPDFPISDPGNPENGNPENGNPEKMEEIHQIQIYVTRRATTTPHH